MAGLAYGASPGITMPASNGGRACGGTSPSGALPGRTLRPPIGAGFSSTLGAAGALAGAAAGAGAAPPSDDSIKAMTSPSDNSSPSLTFNSFTTPPNGAGTSIVALSDSSVIRPWSLATVSPTLTSTSITGTPVLPISGTLASRTALPPAAGAGAGALLAGSAALATAGAGAEAGAAACGAGAAAASSASMMAITVPSDTSSPTFSFTSLTVPANGAGTSIVALSDSSVIRLCSLATLSPGLIITSITGTSAWPISGTRASFRSAMISPADTWMAHRSGMAAARPHIIANGAPFRRTWIDMNG